MNWTTILLTAITTLGTVLTAVFATRAKTHADEARAASLRPPPDKP